MRVVNDYSPVVLMYFLLERITSRPVSVLEMVSLEAKVLGAELGIVLTL